MKIRFNKKIIMNLYIYFVLILTTYTSGFIYNFVYFDYNRSVKWLLIMVSSISLFFLSRREYKEIFLFILLEMFIGIWVILSGGIMLTYSKVVLRITFVFIFFTFCNKNKINLLEYLCNLFIIYAFVYFWAWLIFDIGPLASYGNNLHVTIEIAEGEIRTWNYTEFFHIYYRWKNMRRVFGLNIIASNGPFWEPGLYQIYLNFALWYELFKRKRYWWTVILLISSIIITTSTMGALSLVIILSGYLYCKQSSIMRIISLLPIGVTILFIFNRLLEEKQIHAIVSVNQRENDFIKLIKAFACHPIMGNGLGTCSGFNALLLYIAEFGILGIIFVIFIITMIAKKKGVLIEKLTFIAWLILSLINEPIGYHSLFLLLVFAITQKETLRFESDNREHQKMGKISSKNRFTAICSEKYITE